MTQLAAILAQLDPSNDDQWTKEGLPRIDYLQTITGDQSVDRKAITDANPELNRDWLRAREDAPDPMVTAPEPQAAAPIEPAPTETKPTEIESEDEEVEEERDPVLDMAPVKVYGDRSLCERASKQLDKDEAVLMEYIEASEEELRQIRYNQGLLTRAINLHERKNPTPKVNPVKAYLDSQNRIREKKAGAMQKFLKSGTTAQDVRTALGGRSQLEISIASKKSVQVPAHRLGQQ